MSLKKYKTKSQKIDDGFDYKLEWDSWYTSYWDDDYYDYDYYTTCDNCGKSYCNDYEFCQEPGYIELPKIDWGYKIVNKAFRRWSISDPSLPGQYIDMETIYGKTEMRNRRIDIVLGLREPHYKEPITIGDIYKEKKKRNGN